MYGIVWIHIYKCIYIYILYIYIHTNIYIYMRIEILWHIWQIIIFWHFWQNSDIFWQFLWHISCECNTHLSWTCPGRTESYVACSIALKLQSLLTGCASQLSGQWPSYKPIWPATVVYRLLYNYTYIIIIYYIIIYIYVAV